MKTIIEMAREARLHRPCWEVWQDPKKDAPMSWVVTSAYSSGLETFATIVKAAHVDELLEGVEMPEAACSPFFYGPCYTADQMRDYAATALLRKDAEMRQMGEDLIAIQTMHNEQKARLYEKCADLRNERDAIKAENERLRADAARYQWLRDNHRSAPQHKLTWYLPMNYPRTDNGLDAAIDAAMKGQP